MFVPTETEPVNSYPEARTVAASLDDPRDAGMWLISALKLRWIGKYPPLRRAFKDLLLNF